MFCEKAALTGANMVNLLVEELKVLASPLSCKHPLQTHQPIIQSQCFPQRICTSCETTMRDLLAPCSWFVVKAKSCSKKLDNVSFNCRLCLPVTDNNQTTTAKLKAGISAAECTHTGLLLQMHNPIDRL